MAPGRKWLASKAQEPEAPLHEYERQKVQNMIRNNQRLQSLGLTALSAIVNHSSAKSKSVAREESGSEYEPDEDMEATEHGVLDKNPPREVLARNNTMPTGGSRGSKRVMPPAEQDQTTRVTRQRIREDQTTRMTRQMTREPSSVAEGLHGTTTNTQDELNAANSPTQADQQIQMCNEGESNAMIDRWNRGTSMGKHLDRISRGLNTKLPVVVAEMKKRPEAPLQAAKLASEAGIIVRQHIPIYTHWKEYKHDKATIENYMGKVVGQFSIDTNNNAVKEACYDLLKCRQRNLRHQLKKVYFDGVPADKVRSTSPLKSMTDDQWKALLAMWSTPEHKAKCAKNKKNRGNVQFSTKIGSRCYIAQAHVVKQEKYKDVLPTAIDLFKEMHCGSKSGFSEPVKQAIAEMEAIVAAPAEDGQVPKTPLEAVAQVMPNSTFLQNVGLEPRAPKRNIKPAVSARVQELEDEVESEKQGSAALRDELEVLKLKIGESEDARQQQCEEIEILKKQGEENRKQAEETNSLLRRLLSLNKEQPECLR